MNKYILLSMSIVVFGISACKTDNDSKQTLPVKPGPKVQLPAKEELKQDPEVIPPKPRKPVDNGLDKPIEPEFKKNENVDPVPARFKNSTFVQAWKSQDMRRTFRLLSDDDFYDIGKFELGDNMVFECTFHGKETVVKHILATPEFLNDKDFIDGRISWQQEYSFDQEIGKWDYSFSGLFNYFVGQKMKKTEMVDVTCVEVK